MEKQVKFFDIEAEQIVLGMLIFNNDYLKQVSDYISIQHFCSHSHKKIYNYILNPKHNETLKDFFENEIDIKISGGFDYLEKLLKMSAGIIDIRDYLKLIKELSFRRNLLIYCEEIKDLLYKGADAETIIKMIEEGYDEIKEKGYFTKRDYQRVY